MVESNLVEYDPLDVNLVDDLDDEIKASGSSEFMKLEVGSNVVRFLPAKASGKPAFKLIHEHFIEVPGRDKNVRFACARQMLKGKERCPACEAADNFKRGGNPVDRDRAKDYYPQAKFYANVLNRNDEASGPKILAFGKKIWDQLKTIIKDPREGGDVTNPTNKGFDIIIERAGTGKNDTKYTVRPARSDSPLADDPAEAQAIIEKSYDLDYYAAVPLFNDLVAMMAGDGGGRRAALPSGGTQSAGRGSRAPASTPPAQGRQTVQQPRRRTAQDDVLKEDDDYVDVDTDEAPV